LVSPEWSIRQVMAQIDANAQAIAVVIDESECPVATVTDGDIRRAILRDMDLDLPVQDLIDSRTSASRRAPITAPEGTSNADLLHLMTEYTIRHVPIVDSSGKIVDLIALLELIEEYEPPSVAVVMAGGFGTRLHPLTDDTPKPMLPVGDRPLLELIIEQLNHAGIQQVNITTHFKSEVIIKHFGNGKKFGVDINYVKEDQPLGTAGALSQVETSDGPILVVNGDVLTRVDYRAMLEFHREYSAEMTVAVRQHESQLPFGVVETDGVDVTGISEKPIVRHLINAGIYILEPSAFELIPKDTHFDMTELITKLTDQKRKVVSFPVREYWLDVGQLEDYKKAQEDARAQGFV